jgi:hypothetical protein
MTFLKNRLAGFSQSAGRPEHPAAVPKPLAKTGVRAKYRTRPEAAERRLRGTTKPILLIQNHTPFPLDKKIYAALNAAKQAVKNRDYEQSEKLYRQAVDLARDLLVDKTAIEEFRRALENIGRRQENKDACVEAWADLRGLRAKEILRRIIIPELNFGPPDTLIDAIDFFTQASRDYGDPIIPVSQRGVSLILKLSTSDSENRKGEDPFAVSSDSNSNIPVIQKLSARFISLYDALELVCAVTGYQLSTRGGFVMITPLGDSEESKRLKKDLP